MDRPLSSDRAGHSTLVLPQCWHHDRNVVPGPDYDGRSTKDCASANLLAVYIPGHSQDFNYVIPPPRYTSLHSSKRREMKCRNQSSKGYRERDKQNVDKQSRRYSPSNTISLKHSIPSPDISLITDVTVHEECP